MFSPIYLYRVYRWLYSHHIPKIPGLLQRINYFFTGCDLPANVKIGARPRFQHYGSGVIIHKDVMIGDDVMIMPQVVLGQNVHRNQITSLSHQINIGNRVMLGTGAKIIASGLLEIGDDSAIGANAVVLNSIPAGCSAVGIPARIIDTSVAIHNSRREDHLMSSDEHTLL